MSRVYLDHNALTPVGAPARAAMDAAAAMPAAHPHARHSDGRRARSLVDDTHRAVARLTGFRPSQVVLTSGGTEANAAAVHDLVLSSRKRPARIVVGATEHPSITAPLAAYARAGLCEVIPCPVDANGQHDLHRLADLLRDADGVCLMWAHNESGVVHDVEAIGTLVASHDVRWHCDAVQVAGKTGPKMPEVQAHSLAIASHKLGGPSGIGALITRHPLRFPLMPSVRSKEPRAGTLSTELCAGFSAAIEHMVHPAGVRVLRDRLEAAILATYPGSRTWGSDTNRLDNTLYVSMLHPQEGWVDGQELMMELALRGVCVSTGSACSSGTGRPSPTLLAMGATAPEAHAAVRFSLGACTTADDIDATVSAVRDAMHVLTE